MIHSYYGIFGFIILLLDLWALISVISSRATVGMKLLWVVLILLLPVIGAILWLVMGPRAER